MILSVVATIVLTLSPIAAQTSPTSQAPSLIVRGPRVSAQVPVVASAGAPAIGLERLAPVIPMSVRASEEGKYLVTMAGAEIELTEQLPVARINGTLVSLASSPYVADGRLFVPLQLVTEILPRALPKRFRYASAGRELWFTPAQSESLASVSTAGAPAPTIFRRRASNGAPAGAPPSRPVNPTHRGGRRWRIIVDAGHGGVDNGMTGPIAGGPRIYEKEITLQVANRVRAALLTRGIDVVMTRTYDTLIALGDRGRIANESRGDLFVSIHVNAAPLTGHKPRDWRGFETYFLSEAKTEDDRRVERMENESIRFETGADAAPGDPLSFIINDMAQNEHLRESNELAELIQRRLMKIHPGPDRGVKQAGFRVLVTAFMPAVLVEIGFGTNTAEAVYLSSPSQQQVIANAIATAALEYLGEYERKLGAGGGR
ncbi:MAG: N-acetylmuramoyl-L-alanine amidase [Gemmatimonadaceae bacterium]